MFERSKLWEPLKRELISRLPFLWKRKMLSILLSAAGFAPFWMLQHGVWFAWLSPSGSRSFVRPRCCSAMLKACCRLWVALDRVSLWNSIRSGLEGTTWKKQKFVYGCDFKISCQSHPLLRVYLNVCVNIFRLFVGNVFASKKRTKNTY